MSIGEGLLSFISSMLSKLAVLWGGGDAGHHFLAMGFEIYPGRRHALPSVT